MPYLTKSGWATLAVMLGLLVVPPIMLWTGNEFFLLLATRVVILALAAVSLNLILGYGGLVSFGHAAFLGIGAYAVGIPVYHEFYGGFASVASTNGLFQIGLAVGLAALFALITGAISLRTKGVYFLMITMAFGQMAYYLFQSLSEYGGDDGLVIEQRSELPFLNFDDPLQLYLTAYVVLVLAMVLVWLIVNSRFGMVLRGAKGNNERLVTLGYNTYLYRLVAYVISGAICGLAGALMANFASFISPDMMGWSRSGELMFMVILGGAATSLGPVLGAMFFILIEFLLKPAMTWLGTFSDYLTGQQTGDWAVFWHLPFGVMLILIVIFGRGGVMGFIRGRQGGGGQ